MKSRNPGGANGKLLDITARATLSSLPCAPPARSEEYMVNWKTFSRCYFAEISQKDNVFKITIVAYTCDVFMT